MSLNFGAAMAAYEEVFEAAYVAARDVTAGLKSDVLQLLERGAHSVVQVAARDELDARDAP